MPEDFLTVAQAAAHLHVAPQDVWKRIEEGSLRAFSLLTANGTSYLIARTALFPEEQSGEEDAGQLVLREGQDAADLPAIQSPDQQAHLEEFVRRLLDPLASRLEDVSIELGREREQRESAEQEHLLLARQLAHATDHIITLEARVSEAPSRQELEARAASIAELRRVVEDGERRVHDLEAQLARQTAELAGYEAARAEVARLQAAERSLRQEITQRAEVMAGLRHRAEDAERQVAELQQQVSEHAPAVAAYEESQKEREQLRRQIHRLEQERAEKERSLSDYRQRMERAEARSEDLARRLAEQSTQIGQQAARLDEQNAQLAAQNAKVDEQNAQLTVQDAQITEQKARLDELAPQMEQYEAARKEIARLQQQVEVLESNSREAEGARQRRGWRFWRRTAS